MTEVMQPPCCKDATMRIAMTQRTIFDSSTLRSTLSAFICVSMIFKSGFSGYIVNRSLNANREQYADPNIGGPWCVRTSHVTTILIFMCLYIQIYKDNKITFPHFVFSFQFLFFFLSPVVEACVATYVVFSFVLVLCSKDRNTSVCIWCSVRNRKHKDCTYGAKFSVVLDTWLVYLLPSGAHCSLRAICAFLSNCCIPCFRPFSHFFL